MRYKLKRSQTFYVPEEVEETSGLVYVQGELLTMNDSGGKNFLYALDTLGGEVKRRVEIPRTVNRDWEALSYDGKCIYIGDFGNNLGNRQDLTIYKIEIDSSKNALPSLDSIRFSYPEQVRFEKQKHAHDFDCEAMVVFHDSLFLYSKAWLDGITKIRVLPSTPGSHLVETIANFDAGGYITDAAFDEKNGLLILTGYNLDTPFLKSFLWICKTFHPAKLDKNRALKINLEPNFSQIEGVVFIAENRIAITAEGLHNKWIDIAPALFLLDLSPFLARMEKRN